MNDPKNRPLVYLIAGVIAIVSALYFMTLEDSILDWFILGAGVVAISRAVQEYWQLHGGSFGRKKTDNARDPDAKDPDNKS